MTNLSKFRNFSDFHLLLGDGHGESLHYLEICTPTHASKKIISSSRMLKMCPIRFMCYIPQGLPALSPCGQNTD